MENIYKDKKCRELLKQGDYKGYHYAIVTYGSHPCAYVKTMGITDEDIYVHGGITYEGGDVTEWFPELPKGYYIGWDYAHAGDYISLFGGLTRSPFYDEKKWVLDEIFEEVKNAIDQIEAVRKGREAK